MRILLSNDDGVFAKGIEVMHRYLSRTHTVTVIAPDRNCSGMSSALSLQTPLRIQQNEQGFYSVNGTPSDCVQLGVNSGQFEEPELVVSGINHGPNLGDDTIYSGTVAAALEGRHLGLPALAVSLCSRRLANEHDYFDTAAQLTCQIIDKIADHPLELNQILNINVPNLPFEQVKGIKASRCGKRHRAETMVKSIDPFGKTIYWYGKLGKEFDAAVDTDFYALANGYCSVTPLSTDMTVHQQLPFNEILVGSIMASRKGQHLASVLQKEGITNELVLSTIANVPRELFLPAALAHKAYENTALPIGQGQTISQPYIVARMTELLLTGVGAQAKVLEIGTGSGYQTAVLANIFSQVCSVERIKSLQFQAKRRLNQLDLHNVKMKHGDGWQGWASKGPFDAIIVTAAASDMPQQLIEQLAESGRLIIPVGKGQQNLMCIDKTGGKIKQTVIEVVNFVPLIAGDVQ